MQPDTIGLNYTYYFSTMTNSPMKTHTETHTQGDSYRPGSYPCIARPITVHTCKHIVLCEHHVHIQMHPSCPEENLIHMFAVDTVLVSRAPFGVVCEAAGHGEGESRVKHKQDLVGDILLVAAGLLREHTNRVNGRQLVYNWTDSERGRMQNTTVDD